jgi:hypothetical protein
MAIAKTSIYRAYLISKEAFYFRVQFYEKVA